MRLLGNRRLFYIIGAFVILAMIIPASLVLALGGGNQPRSNVPFRTPTAETTGEATPDGTATPPEGTPEPEDPDRYAEPPAMAIDTSREYVATIRTGRGDIQVRLFAADAPQTVNSFVFLAREGFYDGVTFYRVIPGFVAQTGDPTDRGSGTAGYTLPDEVNDHPVSRGALVMAKRGSEPDSASSQFYIALGDLSYLEGRVTVFGEVVAGMDVVESLTPRDPGEDPDAPPGDRIQTIEIEER